MTSHPDNMAGLCTQQDHVTTMNGQLFEGGLTMNGDETIAPSRTDAVYRTKLVSHPLVTLVEIGVDVPAGVTINIMDDIVDAQHIVLSVAPAGYGDAVVEEAKLVADVTIIAKGYN